MFLQKFNFHFQFDFDFNCSVWPSHINVPPFATVLLTMYVRFPSHPLDYMCLVPL